MMTRLFHGLIVPALLVSVSLSPRARVLDDFNDNTKTGWQDFTFVPGFGIPTESGGQFKFNLPPAGQAIFVASTKTSETFTIADGTTIEFRVDLVSGNGPDAFAVLAFIPASSSVDTLSGYGFAKSESDILVTKGIQKYFYNENPTPALKNQNVTMVLSLTGRGSDVVIHAQLLDRDDNNAVIFEQTFVDTPGADVLSDGTDDPAVPYTGAGNFVLLCYEDFDDGAPQGSYEVTFDNAEVFVLEEVLVDDFNDNLKTNWQDFTFVPGFGLPVETGGQFKFELPPAGQALFVASTKTSPVFELKEGEKLRFQVDVVEGYGVDSFAVLAFIPTTSSASTLAGYGFAQSTTDVLLTKGISKYFYNEHLTPELKNSNVTLVLTLEVREGNVIINGQIRDKDQEDAVIFDQTFIDTPAADILVDGEDDPPAPYIGTGNFVLYCYEDFDEDSPQDAYRVIYDNAIAAAPPLPDNSLPGITDISPLPFSNFVAADAGVSFSVSDDKDLADENISLILNGETFTSANGLTVSGTGNSRTVSFDGLEANVNYVASLRATDSDGETTSLPLFFDTFTEESVVVEAEDFNFSFFSAGTYINDPVPHPEGDGPYEDGYGYQFSTINIDYFDTRTTFEEVPYRPFDYVRMRRSLDYPRQKYIDAGGREANVYDYDVQDIAAGEWLNYTRSFPAGSYEVYLRESLVNGTQVEAVLEEVTSDRTVENQTTRVLGSFRTPTTGFLYKNVPLTDAVGSQKVVLNLSGETTLRLRQVSADPSDGAIFQNYLVFVPVESTGVQRATVSAAAPLGSISSLAPAITATIQNRDTDVLPATIKLFVEDTEVNATVNSTATGADVSYNITPLPPAGSTVEVRLEYEDSENVVQTNRWSFVLNYLALNPANRRPAPGIDRGFTVRLVQAPAGSGLENSLSRAELQLAANSTIPKEIDATNVSQVVNFSESEGSSQGQIGGDLLAPGLDPLSGNFDDYAVEITGYLELTAGIHRFGIISDDGYKLQSAASLTDRNATPLEFHNGGPANETFDFQVSAAGLYPFRLVWYERGGAGHVEWTSINRETGERTLINDPANANAIKAYQAASAPTLQVESAATVDGAFALEAAAQIDTTARTVTVPLGTGNRFFRLSGTVAHQLSGAQVSSGNLVFSYE